MTEVEYLEALLPLIQRGEIRNFVFAYVYDGKPHYSTGILQARSPAALHMVAGALKDALGVVLSEIARIQMAKEASIAPEIEVLK